MTVAAIYLAMILDRIFGEPKYFHPLVGFGNVARLLENYLLNSEDSPGTQTVKGFIAWVLMVLPPVLILIFIIKQIGKDEFILWLLNAMVLYLVIGANSLEEHVLKVKSALLKGNISKARKAVSYMVSRNTEALDEEGISKASIESVLENGSDAIFAPLFWFIIAGAPGALCYRLLNTLDAMWGYRNERYLHFGWAAARLDDLFNWLPARLTSLSYALMGDFQEAMRCWRKQASSWKSPNAGPVMISGAGALHLKLGGVASYDGKQTERPIIGCGRFPNIHDIDRVLELVQRTILLWLIVITIFTLLSKLW